MIFGCGSSAGSLGLQSVATCAPCLFMPPQEGPAFFDQTVADKYDQQAARLAPLRDALHLLIGVVFSGLPAQARVLCAGAGTGAELLYLAEKFPQWHFTAVEPSAPMLEVCRRRAAESGIASRCVFHEGYLDSLLLRSLSTPPRLCSFPSSFWHRIPEPTSSVPLPSGFDRADTWPVRIWPPMSLPPRIKAYSRFGCG